MIKANPKPIIGYSDLTALLNAVFFRTGMVTFHGPMGTSIWNNTLNGEYARRVVLDREPVVFKNPASFTPAAETIQSGKATGVLIGGNLSVFVSLIGTKYFPSNFTGRDYILFLEDVGEVPYKVDRMLQTLVLSGIMDQVQRKRFSLSAAFQ